MKLLSALLLLLFVAPLPTPDEDPAPIADAAAPHGSLRFAIVDATGEPMPGRLTFTDESGEVRDLFPNVGAKPTDLAVRKNVVYCLSGKGVITVPTGTYTVHATRGIEWSLASTTLTIAADSEVEHRFALRREVDSTGWISGDFHLHTLTYSGHGDSNLEERLISLVGEGVEFGVATDHNHHTDYDPTMETLGIDGFTAVVGNEVSVPLGHFNAFPLEPDRPVPDPHAKDGTTLFRFIRDEPNRFGIVPVIQVNHPRWGSIDYFGEAGLDPVTGVAHGANWSADFDTIEVFNENACWGYFDADVAGERPVGSSVHSVLRDWYNLLNRGARYFAVGNSDSHTVHSEFTGYPRNFVQSSTDEPGAIDVAEVAANLRRGQAYTTTGPLVDFTVDGVGMGETVTAIDGQVEVRVRIQSPAWIRADRVKIVVGGDVVETVDLDPRPREDGGIEYAAFSRRVEVPRDTWIHVAVEGDQDLAPIVPPTKRPILPLAVTNPVWIDADGDGEWISPWDQARARAAVLDQNPVRLRPSEMALLVLARAEAGGKAALATTGSCVAASDRGVQLAALRAAELLADPTLAPKIDPVFSAAGDAYLALTAARALAVCDPEGRTRRMNRLLDRFGAKALQRYPVELDRLLGWAVVRDWMAIGPFPNPHQTVLFQETYPVQEDPALWKAHPGKKGPVHWVAPTVAMDGYVNLGLLDPSVSPHSISFGQTWLHVDEPRTVSYAMGSDDGCRLWLNSEEIHRDETRHGASPMQHLGQMNLEAGWNRLLLGVENGGGPTGFYFMVLDEAVKVSATGG